MARDKGQAENLIGRGLLTARKRSGITLEGLSLRLKGEGVGVGKAAVGRWERGERVPNAYQFMALCRALDIEDIVDHFSLEPKAPELNETGLKKLSEYKADLIASGRYSPEAPDRIRYISMPVSLLPVSAGTGAFLDEGNFETIEVPETSVPKGAVFGLYVSGDSMEPVYKNGQLVWVRPCETLNIGEVGIFLYDGCGYMKAYDEKDTVSDEGIPCRRPALVSYNPAYPPIDVSPEAPFSVAGKVL